MVSSRMALEELLQNRLTTRICEDPMSMRASAADLFHLCAGKHHADDASLSSSGAGQAAIKRETHSPTCTDQQSEDSGVDVSASAASAFHGADGGHGRCFPAATHKRKRPNDSDRADGCPTAIKSSRTDVALSVNVVSVVSDAKTAAARARAGLPFRPWSCSEESSSSSTSDASLRLYHDIRNVDRIRTLTQKKAPPTPEPEPLDLTNGGRSRAAPDRVAVPVAETPAPRLQIAAVPAPIASVADMACAATSTTDTAARYSKNMSRARRIEANARERSRVHTISAAFDTLRATVPSYSRNQKLSKLSTIRIASAYILTLSRLLDLDYSAEQDGPSVEECVRNVTGIIHMEGKTKKKKDER